MVCMKKNLLQTKQELLKWKRKGGVFFLEELSSLNLKQEFLIYFSQSPSKEQDRKAFPIPPNLLKDFMTAKDYPHICSNHFHSYYETDDPYEDSFYNEFKHFYRGSEWVWVYRKGNDPYV